MSKRFCHWHVHVGFCGCYPEVSEFYDSRDAALEAFWDYVLLSHEAGIDFITVWKDLEIGEIRVDDVSPTSTYYISVSPCYNPFCVLEDAFS